MMMNSSNYNKPRRALAEKSNDTASNNNNNSQAANPMAKAQQEKKQQLMDEFVKERVQQLEQELEIIKQEQRQLIGNTILKMPKSARNMTLGEYRKKYGVNLLEELPPPTAPTFGSAAAATAAFAPMTPATGLRNMSKFTKATPMTMRTRPMATPATVRALRRGEAVFSQRGSPLNALEEGCLVATVEAPRRRPGAMAGAKHTAAGYPTKNGPHFPTSPEIDFHLGAGQCLSLKDSESLQHLDSSAKEAAAAQIRIMKEQMDRILSRLEQE